MSPITESDVLAFMRVETEKAAALFPNKRVHLMLGHALEADATSSPAWHIYFGSNGHVGNMPTLEALHSKLATLDSELLTKAAELRRQAEALEAEAAR